jgi:hypothetical protein
MLFIAAEETEESFLLAASIEEFRAIEGEMRGSSISKDKS